jgi:hypothetical protein
MTVNGQRDVRRFRFHTPVEPEHLERQIALAIVVAECVFGTARVRLDVSYLLERDRLVIDVSNEIGAYVAQVFTGLISRQLGEDSFTVERVEKTRKDMD